MSDTPRTETERLGSNIKNQSDSDKEWPWSAIDRGWDFARILERELAAVAAERDALKAKLDMGTPCLFEGGKRKDIQEVTAERDEATSEMERYREAYDIACDEREKLRNELSAATIANQHKLITDAEQRGEKKADEAWIERENELMTDSARWKHLWQEVTKERDAMKHALIELEAAAESYAADQSGATDRRCGLVQPITVEDGNRLLSALRIANELTK